MVGSYLTEVSSEQQPDMRRRFAPVGLSHSVRMMIRIEFCDCLVGISPKLGNLELRFGSAHRCAPNKLTGPTGKVRFFRRR